MAHGRFGDDAHELAERRAGAAVWLPAMARFFADLGLPFERLHDIALAEHEAPPPAATHYAVLADAAAVPALRGAGVGAYAQFLKADRPRAFAVGEDGSWSWYSGPATR